MAAVEARLGISGAREYRRSIQPLVDIADTCVPDDLTAPTQVNHTENTKPSDYSNTWGFLNSTDASSKKVARYINRASQWVYKAKPFEAFRRTSLQDLHRRLEMRLGPLIELGNSSLRVARVNDHSVDLHVKPVVVDTVALLEQAGCSEELQEDGMYAAWGHDGANPFSKSAHARIGIKVLQRVIPEITKDSERWKRIRRAIEFHDSSFVSPLIAQMDKMGMSFQQKTEAVRQYIGPVGAALHIADKIHVNENRIFLDPSYGNPTDFVTKDPHKRINVQTGTEYAGLSDDRTKFIWHLKIYPFVSANNFHRLRQLVRPGSTNLRERKLPLVPKLGDEINKDPKKALAKIAADFHRIYPTRMTEMPLFVFALFPNVTDFEIVFSIETEKGPYKEQLVDSINRDGKRNSDTIRNKPHKLQRVSA